MIDVPRIPYLSGVVSSDPLTMFAASTARGWFGTVKKTV
jgi:hypothetical protein